MSLGVSEYLIKPFSKSEIDQAVNKALDRREANTGQQKEVRTLLEQMRTLTDTSAQGASYQDFRQNATGLLEQSMPTLHASAAVLYVTSGPEQFVCEIVAGRERHRGFAEEAWCKALGTVMAGGRPVRLTLDASEFFLRDRVQHLQSMGYEGGILFPIHAGQEALGMLACFYETAADIPSHWLDLGHMFPNLLALAIRAHQRYQQSQQEAAQQAQRIAQLSILREIARVLMDKLDLQDMLHAIGEQLQAGLGYTGFHVWLQEQDSPRCQYVYGSGDASAWQPETLDELRELQEQGGGQVVGPLILDGGNIGAISLSRGSPQGRLAAFEVKLIRMVLEYLSMAVKNSQLYGEMKETKGYLENLISSAGDAIITVDTEGVITSWNAAAERIFCLPYADAFHHNLSKLYPGGHAQIQWLFDVMTEGQIKHVETRLQQPDGALIDCSLTLSPLLGADDKVVGVSAIIKDVTQDKKLREQLMQSEKLSALGEMAAGVAHNFKNILGMILGYAEHLLEAPGTQEEVEEGLMIIEKAARDATQVVQRIQTYARSSSNADDLEPTDLRQLVKETVDVTRPIWKEQAQQRGNVIDVNLEFDDIPLVRSRAAEIREVVTNLIINAVDAMGHDGSLTLSTYAEGAYACIRVTDTGPGMTEAVQRRVFDPFFTTKGNKGTGLGLSVSHTQVKSHGGDIQLESELGVGTSFTIKLPI
jgi:PAS domain S-box-containing protein